MVSEDMSEGRFRDELELPKFLKFLDDLIKKRINKILNEFIFVIFGKKHNKHKI